MASDNETTELALSFAPPTPAVVLTDPQHRSKFFKDMKAQLAGFKPDTSTPGGRKAIASMAFKVTRTKTAIDDAGKKLTEDARAVILAVNKNRTEVWEELDTLAKETRAPLTLWERNESVRAGKVNDWFETVRLLSTVTAYDTAEDIRKQIEAIEKISDIDPAVFQEQEEAAKQQHADALESLTHALARAEKAEADAAELEKLRQEQAEREAQAVAKAEADQRAAEEAAAKAAADEAARLEEERQAIAAKEAAELARQAEEERAAKEAAAIEQAKALVIEATKRDAEARHAAELAAEREKNEAAYMAQIMQREKEAQELAAEKARREKLEQEAAEREAEAKRLSDEQAARDADRKHRGEVMKAAKEAIMRVADDDISEQTAKAIVLAIVAGEIPNVTLKF